MSTIASWFADVLQARQAVLDLLTAGVPRQDIGVLVGADASGEAASGARPHDFVETLVGARRLALPEVGAVAVAGPPAAALDETGGAGDLRSALVAVGLPEAEAQAAAAALGRGAALVVARTDDARDSIVRGVFHHYADPALREHDETVGPIAERDPSPENLERPVSTSLGALTGGMVPGGWGPAGAVFEGTDEAGAGDEPRERGLPG